MNIYFRYLKEHRLAFFIAITCVALESSCDLMGPTIMARIINFGISTHNMDNVIKYGSLMLVITALGASFAIIRSILASTISQKVGTTLRNDLFRKILNFFEGSIDKLPSGTLITRMTNDTNQIVQFVNGMMRIIIKAPITCIGSIILASLLNFKLSIIIYSVVLVIGLLIFFSLKYSYPRFALLQKAIDGLNTVIQEYLGSVRLIKAFGTYDEETTKFTGANENIQSKSISAMIIVTFISPLLTLIVGLSTIAIIYYGSNLFSTGQILPGDISAFIIYTTQMLTSLMMITNIFNIFVRTQASAERIEEVFNCQEDFDDIGIKKSLSGNIEFKDVTFFYPESSEIPVIENLSFSIKAGEKLAIIGPTGSGKSTLTWLLLRFYDVNEGSISFDNHDIKDFSISNLRSSIALAPQKAMLFSGSVLENMIWGNPKASKTVINKAVNLAQADFINNMENGINSYLSSGSVNISGGQKQRISLVRAMLKNSPILILDDVTSSLDAITEAKVRDGLLKNTNQTLIIITQKCSTAQFADKILVLEDGLKKGFGTHKQLLKDCEVYQAIYQSQMLSDSKGKYHE